LPLDIFHKLVTDPSIEVRTSVGENLQAPDEIFEVLAKDSSDDVRLSLSSNALVPTHILEALAADENMFVASNAKKTLAAINENIDSR